AFLLLSLLDPPARWLEHSLGMRFALCLSGSGRLLGTRKTPFTGGCTMTTDALNSLLRGEISATETWTQALEKFSGQPEQSEVQRIRDDHREAANTLRQHVHKQHSEPATGSGAWGAWAKLVEGTAKAFGKTAALKALKEGEEHGIKQYQKAL